MICRASSGPDAPPVGARLQVGIWFLRRVREATGSLCAATTPKPIRVWIARAAAPWVFVPLLAVPVRVGENQSGSSKFLRRIRTRFPKPIARCCSVSPKS